MPTTFFYLSQSPSKFISTKGNVYHRMSHISLKGCQAVKHTHHKTNHKNKYILMKNQHTEYIHSSFTTTFIQSSKYYKFMHIRNCLSSSSSRYSTVVIFHRASAGFGPPVRYVCCQVVGHSTRTTYLHAPLHLRYPNHSQSVYPHRVSKFADVFPCI